MLNLREVEEFVAHYKANNGYILDEKYLGGTQVKSEWVSVMFALDFALGKGHGGKSPWEAKEAT